MFFRLEGVIQHYLWGGDKFIANFLHIQASETNYAEYWLGSHVTASAKILVDNHWLRLDEYLTQHANLLLSTTSIAKYGKKLPFLLKILDVKKPLSIQIHPTKKQAEIGFAQENKQNIALDAKNRTYKDDNHKPEMMIALSEFWLLHGFKPKPAIIDCLSTYPSLKDLAEKLACHNNLIEFYTDIMQASQQQLQQWLAPIIQQQQNNYLQAKLTLDNPDYWLLYTIDSMQIDLAQLEPGLLCFYIFNLVQIKKDEGIFQDAGIPHAYLRGQNIELMAASDNVIRGGLTTKFIDIPALLATINSSEIIPKIMPPAIATEHLYPTACADFALKRLTYNSQQKSAIYCAEASILLVMEGSIKLTDSENTIELRQGEAVFISYNSKLTIIPITNGYAVVASQA